MRAEKVRESDVSAKREVRRAEHADKSSTRARSPLPGSIKLGLLPESTNAEAAKESGLTRVTRSSVAPGLDSASACRWRSVGAAMLSARAERVRLNPDCSPSRLTRRALSSFP